MFFLNFRKIIYLKALIVVVIVSIFITVIKAEAYSEALTWPEEIIEAYIPESGGVWYPRLVELKNGDWLMSFDTNEESNDIQIKVVRSSDQGETWGSPVTVVDEPLKDGANGQMLQLENGDIWLAYRLVEETEEGFNTYLRVKVSSDNGETWEELAGGQIDEESASNYKGVWEPHLGYIEDEIAVMYAHDGPSVAGNTDYQNIMMRKWEGNSWSEPITVTNGMENRSRDGMPVWAQMENGDYILVFEASNEEDHPFVIKYKTSSDGFNWSEPRVELYTPNGVGKKAGAPYIEKLSDGRLVASFQTDEASANTGDAYSSMKTVVSSDNGSTWGYAHHTFPVSDETNANWNSLMAVSENQIIAATSANYPTDGLFLRRGFSDTPASVNLVNNWSFETANVNGWTTYGDDYPERLLVQGIHNGLDRPLGGGDYFIGMAGTSGPSTAYIGQSIQGLDDGVYTMQAFMRSSGGQDSCFMEVKDYGGDEITVNCPVGTGWSLITIPDVYVTDGQANIGFYASMNNDNQWADIDMVEFVRH